VREKFPQVRIIENRANLGYARANNVGIAAAQGDYVLILNPDTIIHERALDKWVAYAERHPEAGAFGCKVLNPDGSWQEPARPFPTIGFYWQLALRLRPNAYLGWKGESEREIDWQSGCCILVRNGILKELGGFDERFFYHFEEVDLCRRIWDRGMKILYTPDAVITHLCGQSVGRFPIRFELEKYRNRYRYFYKYFGLKGLERCRTVSLAHLWIRKLGYGLVNLLQPSEATRNRLEMLRVVARWNLRLNPKEFVETGQEPATGYQPLLPAGATAALRPL